MCDIYIVINDVINDKYNINQLMKLSYNITYQYIKKYNLNVDEWTLCFKYIYDDPQFINNIFNTACRFIILMYNNNCLDNELFITFKYSLYYKENTNIENNISIIMSKICNVNNIIYIITDLINYAYLNLIICNKINEIELYN